MTNRISRVIAQAKEEHRLAFIGLAPIIPDSKEKTLQIAEMMIDSGVDIIMVHIPNWFPWMEGDVLQTAARNVRNAGVTRENIFEFIKELRDRHPETPIMDMTLYDTAMTMGQERFLAASELAEVDGLDLPDYPLFQTNDKFHLHKWCLENNCHLILDISYEEATAKENTIEYQLLQETSRLGRGFVFVMNAPGGKSGSKEKLTAEQLKNAVDRVRSMMAEENNKDCTISVVCGISNAEDLEKIKKSGAESFMIGSAYVDMILKGQPLTEVSDYLKGIRKMCSY